MTAEALYSESDLLEIVAISITDRESVNKFLGYPEGYNPVFGLIERHPVTSELFTKILLAYPDCGTRTSLDYKNYPGSPILGIESCRDFLCKGIRAIVKHRGFHKDIEVEISSIPEYKTPESISEWLSGIGMTDLINIQWVRRT